MSAPDPGPQRSRAGKTLSLLIPMHNEAASLETLFTRIDLAMITARVACEIICIDDGSDDDTLARLRARAVTDRRVKVLALSRNFGKEAALSAGLSAATGDMVTPLDADLQDPPELIAEFVALWEQGYDVVYGVRVDRSSDSAAKRLTAAGFYRVFNLISDYPIPAGAGDFRLMDRAVVEALQQLPERNRFMKGLFSWVGFRQVGVPYARPPRETGQTSFRYPKLWRFALDGLTSFTTAPLRVWTSVGLIAAVIALAAAAAVVLRVIIVGRDVPGYASLMVVFLFGFAANMLAFGILGEYIGRMYEEVKQRPLYLVRERIGFDR